MTFVVRIVDYTMLTMEQIDFEKMLTIVCARLTKEAQGNLFKDSKQFESRVREVTQEEITGMGVALNFDPHPQAFPDSALGKFGI